MGEPVTIEFIFKTIGVILAVTVIGIIFVKYKSKK
jgi:ABC-type sulfate transport system permease component